ncbi:hypothetical protein JOE49_003674 [Paenibacillus sp. PvR133]|nr:hypothetical protein [Paenibacillus sp. PvR133]
MNTGNRLQLSILDFVHVYNGSDAKKSLQNIRTSAADGWTMWALLRSRELLGEMIFQSN